MINRGGDSEEFSSGGATPLRPLAPVTYGRQPLRSSKVNRGSNLAFGKEQHRFLLSAFITSESRNSCVDLPPNEARSTAIDR